MLADLAGRDVVAFDLFGDLDLRASRVVTAGGLTALVDAALAEPPGTVVYGASFENHPKLVARLAERHTVAGNPPETLRAVRDPQQLAAVLRDVPAISFTTTVDRSRRWLRKPLRGGGGTRVRDWRGGALAAGTYLQERIEGSPCSAAAIANGEDAVVLGLTEQLVGRRAFGVRGYRWCGNVTLEHEGLKAQASEICSQVARAFGLRGLFGVDFIWDGERAWTLEVNPRPTASLELFGDGDTLAAHLRGELSEPRPPRATGKAVLFATEDITIGDSERWLEVGVRDVPHPGEKIAAGRPICTLFTTAPEPVAALEEQAARLLEVPAHA